MQKVKGVCTECGGDGLRMQVGLERGVPKCTHCGGSGMEPVEEGHTGLLFVISNLPDGWSID